MHSIEKNREATTLLMLINHKHKVCLESELTSNNIDLYPAQHRILMKLNLFPGINQKELAKIMQVSPATVTISVKKLVKQGYIEKTNNNDDNRYNNLSITAKGKELISKSVMVFDSIDEKLYEGFSDEDFEKFYTYLGRIYDNIRHLGSEDGDFEEECLAAVKAKYL